MSRSPEPLLDVSRRQFFIVACLACRSLFGDEELRRLPPAKEVPCDPALKALLARMHQIVKDRDHRSLEGLMARNFRVEFDVGQGPQVFRRHWCTESRESPVWRILERLLSLDGTFYSRSLYALPYVYARFPVDLDPLGHVVAVSDHVALFARPETGATPIGLLRFSIVSLAQPMELPVILPAEGFLEVNHPELGRCFVAASDVYSPAGHRAFFEKRGGDWRWISLAAATLAAPAGLKPQELGARGE